MTENNNLPIMAEASTEQIQNLIYVIRGKQVMIDSDLAMLYRVETKRLNESVKRNIDRFPSHFRFQLSEEEVQQANKTIVLIDGYVDIVTLNILAKKKDGVDIMVYTLPSARLTAQDIANFNAQYPNLTVKHTTAFHDRFMIIDGSTAYHIGASIKDAGKKCFGINKIEDIGVINDLLQRAVLTS